MRGPHGAGAPHTHEDRAGRVGHTQEVRPRAAARGLSRHCRPVADTEGQRMRQWRRQSWRGNVAGDFGDDFCFFFWPRESGLLVTGLWMGLWEWFSGTDKGSRRDLVKVFLDACLK